MPPRQLRDHYHLSLSIGKALWDDLVGAALPYRVGDGQFDVGKLVYQGAKQLQVKEKVVALLEDKNTPPAVAEHETNVTCDGRGSETTTSAAGSAALFATVIV